MIHNLGYSELILGNYKAYNEEINILNNLTNIQIKDAISKYLNEDNLTVMEIKFNERRWFTPIFSFILNSILFFEKDIVTIGE